MSLRERTTSIVQRVFCTLQISQSHSANVLYAFRAQYTVLPLRVGRRQGFSCSVTQMTLQCSVDQVFLV
jgi:hypothetical protein